MGEPYRDTARHFDESFKDIFGENPPKRNENLIQQREKNSERNQRASNNRNNGINAKRVRN